MSSASVYFCFMKNYNGSKNAKCCCEYRWAASRQTHWHTISSTRQIARMLKTISAHYSSSSLISGLFILNISMSFLSFSPTLALFVQGAGEQGELYSASLNINKRADERNTSTWSMKTNKCDMRRGAWWVKKGRSGDATTCICPDSWTPPCFCHMMLRGVYVRK